MSRKANRKNYTDPGPVPDRWLHCPRKATSLIADKFLAFKTPLNSRFDDKVPETNRFTPNMLLDSTKSYGYRIGLWIDLTNTSRFYDKSEVEGGYGDENEVHYVKLQCRGHGETPSEDQTKAFNSICAKYMRSQPLKPIGVHCTHGFNRTGFLIICYLVEKLDWGLEAAILEFSKARQPGIYKQDYLEELYRRYDPDAPPQPAPVRPSWCLEYDDGEDGIPYQPSDGRGPKRKMDSRRHDSRGKKRFYGETKIPQFMEGINGITPVMDAEIVEKVQRAAQNMCDWGRDGFPGSQPVSLDKTNIVKLHNQRYEVSWKADGTRYMMAILGANEVYMIDRDNCVFEVSDLKFVSRKNLSRHLTNTLLDGEMVIDRFQGANIPRYLVYDVICVDGFNVTKYPFSPARKACIHVDIIKPRHEAIQNGVIDKRAEPFSVREKLFGPLETTAKFLGEKFSHELPHEPDGLIFQPCSEPYVAGTSPNVLKWKPPSHNSIDFKLKIVKEEGLGLLPQKIGQLYVGGRNVNFGTIKVTKDLMQYDNKIIECRFENNKWIFMRERTDKSFPNSDKTAQAVFQSIKDPVTKEYLLNFISHNRYKSDAEIMPPPPSRR